MVKLSVLIFSRGGVDNVINLVKDVYAIADKIVLMDASDSKDKDELIKKKKELKLGKLIIFDVPAIGYPDPLRMYALKKFNGEWVLYLDTDERISGQFRKDIKEIISDKQITAYAIKRYEEVKDPNNLPIFATWQIRLFRSNAVVYTGMPHEQPKVIGKLGRLDGKTHFMMHLSKLMSRKTQLDYNEIEKFERLTYGIYNKKMLGYLSKLLLQEDRDISKELSGKIALAIAKSGQKIAMKKEDEELSNADYFMYYSTLDLIYYTLEGNVKGLVGIIPKERRHVRQINKWQREKDGAEVLEISKIFNDIGMTKFLNLDSEQEIKRINKRKEKGAKLLLALIRERYRSVRSKKSKDQSK